MPLAIIENLDLKKPSFRPSKWPRKLKPAKNSKLPKLPENCFEPVGKGGWPPISTWITQSSDIYPIITIAAFVTLARKLGSQHILHIKDGESDNDKEMVLFSISSFVLYFRMCMYLG
jgi:hypothetical protein